MTMELKKGVYWVGVLVGSPTLNNGLLPSLTPILEDLRGLKFQRSAPRLARTAGAARA